MMTLTEVRELEQFKRKLLEQAKKIEKLLKKGKSKWTLPAAQV